MEITFTEARKLILASQGLLNRNPFGRGKKAVLKAMERLGYVQIDAISVIERAHHHTLWNRAGNYRPAMLYDMLGRDRTVLEYWSHAAAFLPMKHYRYCLHTMHHMQSAGYHWFTVDAKVKDFVYDRIAAEGPLYARDFAGKGKLSGEMWDLKPAKQALHELFMQGKLMVSARDNFHRRYDLSERVIPPGVDTSLPSPKEQAAHYLLSAINAQGLVSTGAVCYLCNWIKPLILQFLPELIEEGRIIEVTMGKSPSKVFYSTPDQLAQIPKRANKSVYLISPFDNAIIQRKRLDYFFNFNYQTEIYLPPHKRVYGYFAMPILWGTEFIGRLDPKAVRKTGVLIINNLQIEPRVKINDRLTAALKKALWEFALFNGCDSFQVLKSDPSQLAAWLNAADE